MYMYTYSIIRIILYTRQYYCLEIQVINFKHIQRYVRINSMINTPSPPTKSLDFGGFDSSGLLILRGGNSHVR